MLTLFLLGILNTYPGFAGPMHRWTDTPLALVAHLEPPTEKEAKSKGSGETPAYESVDALLDALEKAAEPVQNLSAKIRYTTEDTLLGDTTTRTGELHFRRAPATGARQFAVSFVSLQSGDTVEKVSKDYIFDGIYLVERLNDEKQFFKRQTVRTGEQIDPLSIDGPFPLPLGQKKADILKRFEAEMLEPDAEGARKGFLHIRLTARNRGQEENLDTVDLWYDPATLMPRKVIVKEKAESGDINTAELAEVTVNGPAADDALYDTKEPAREEGWFVEIAPLKDE